MNFKKLFVIVLLFIISSFLISTRVDAAAVTGWAWSSNIGWIQFNTGSASPVDISTTTVSPTVGTFSGYAWSSNIGWISFNATAGCPIMPGNGTCQGKINMTTGAVTGWARACVGTINKDCASSSRTDGWDGWIELSGVNHQTGNGGVTFSTTTGNITGFAFSQVIGWLQFDGKCPGCVGAVTPPSSEITVDIKANNAFGNIEIADGASASISWSTTGNPDSCVITRNTKGTLVPNWSSGLSNTGISTGNMTYTANDPTSFIANCTKTGQSSAQDTVEITITPPGGSDLCLDIAGVQTSVPVGRYRDASGNCPLQDSPSENATLSITRPLPISNTKQIRVNQSIDLKWGLPSILSGQSCAVTSTISPANPSTINGWTGLNVYSTTTTTLPRMRIGDYNLQINCANGSSTNPVFIKVVDPGTGEL